MMPKSTPGVTPLKSTYVPVTCKNQCEEGEDRIPLVKIAFFFAVEKIENTIQKSTLRVKYTDHMEIPRILTKQ